MAGSRAVFARKRCEELKRYSWPGNVRELRNVVERTLLLAPAGAIDADTVRLALPTTAIGAHTAKRLARLARWRSAWKRFERVTILAELKRQNHHMTNTAKALGLERSHLYKKCEHLGIDLRSVRKIE